MSLIMLLLCICLIELEGSKLLEVEVFSIESIHDHNSPLNSNQRLNF